MNPTQAREMAKALNAWADKQPVQYRNPGGAWYDWDDAESIAVSPEIQLRVKPVPRDIWVNFYPQSIGAVCFENPQAARASDGSLATEAAVHFREVL